MITKITEKNRAQYQDLFDKASAFLATHNESLEEVEIGSQAALLRAVEVSSLDNFNYVPNTYYYKHLLNNDGTEYEYIKDTTPADGTQEHEALIESHKPYYEFGITSLSEYFSYITYLTRWEYKQESQGISVPKFSYLPLDEGLFEIDADSRTITVPESYVKYGVSVQGDEIAEVIYFKIARFYDAQDLADKEIMPLIQWKSAATNPDGTNKEGVSAPWTVDYDMFPGYVVIGWPICSAVTEAAGTVQLSVRFVKWDSRSDSLSYSLATQPQQVTIKNSLDFDLSKYIGADGKWKTNVCDHTTLMLNRWHDTEYNDPNNQASVPQILVDLDAAVNPTTMAPNSEDVVSADGTDVQVKSKTTKAYVQAVTGDQAGRITYVWKKYDYDTNQLLDVDFEIAYIESPDQKANGTRNANKPYYLKPDPLVNAYTPLGTSAEDDALFSKVEGDDGFKQIYEQVSMADITSKGKYSVVITNRVGRSTASVSSKELVIAHPVAPVIVTPAQAASKILKADTDDYKASITINTTITDQGVQTYQWYRIPPTADVNTANAEALTDNAVYSGSTKKTLVITGSDTEDPSTGAVGDGRYYCIVTNHLNKETNGVTAVTRTDGSNAVITRVTHPAVKLEVKFRTSMKNKRLSLAASEGIDFLVKYPDTSSQSLEKAKANDPEDKITYQWYQYVQGAGRELQEDINMSELNAYTPGEEDVELDPTTNSTARDALFKPTEPGYYFVKVTHKYNGTEAVTISPIYTINNA